MTASLKPLAEQVVVITGATSGIGLSTARRASARGAAVFLIARNAADLETLAEELRSRGGRAAFAAADVADELALRRAGDAAIAAFGGFDTWVNNAGVSIYGRIEDTPIAEQRKLFETNYWGVVHGSRIAVEHLGAQKGAGALITVGSVLGDYPVPLQGPYAATKHAVKGFVNALRLELLKDAPQIHVTLIKPSAIDTPYKEHARSHLEAPGTNPPPVYAAPLVADAILHAAERPTRQITVGGGGRLMVVMAQLFPAVIEPFAAHLMPALSRERGEHGRADDALERPGHGLRERAPYGFVRETSLYTQAQMNGARTALGLVGGLALVWGAMKLGQAFKIAGVRRTVRRQMREKYEAKAARAAQS